MFVKDHIPTSFDELVFEEQAAADRLRQYAENRRHGHIIMYGEYGTGKSTAAQVIANARCPDDAQTLPVDIYTGPELADDMAANLNRIEHGWTIQKMSGVEHPVAIVDEVDQLTVLQQYKLRAFMDRASRLEMGSIIMTTNHPDHIDKGLLNRCDQVAIKALSPETMFNRCREILDREGIEMGDAELGELLETTDGSWRDALRAVEDSILAAEDELAA